VIIAISSALKAINGDASPPSSLPCTPTEMRWQPVDPLGKRPAMAARTPLGLRRLLPPRATWAGPRQKMLLILINIPQQIPMNN
jgi:hypothetical protein